MLFFLRFLLFVVLAHAVVRFVRGLRHGLGGGRFQQRTGTRHQPLEFDESDIIDAQYTEIPDGERDRRR
ncbi:MAG: hypothetical protein PVF43_07625 [Candidatus Eiseniibacteriota bacterium]|jgi:hypothetical protein